MSEAIIVALISAAVTLIGTVLAVVQTSKKTQEGFSIHQAVTDEKIEHLTREVRRHNGFAEKIPVIEEQIKVANHRIDDLENKLR